MNDNIYVIDAGQNYMIINIDSLEYIMIPKNEILKFSYDEKLKVKLSYIDRFKPVSSKEIIEPTIITSFNCNYSCEYCFEHGIERCHERLLPQDIPLIMDFYQAYCNLYSFPFTFGALTIMGGEPLLPENRETLEHISELWPDSLLKITTNGTYIEEYSDYIINNKVQFKVSVDGTEEIHFRRRRCQQKDAYEKAIKGISMLLNNQINTTIVTVFNPENIENYPRFFDLLEGIGWLRVPELTVGFVLEIGCGGDDIATDNVIRALKAFRKLKSIDKRAYYVNAQKLVPGCLNLVEAIMEAQQKMYDPYRCVCLGSPDFTFFPDGTIHLCTAFQNSSGCVGRYKPNIEIDQEKIELFRKRRIDTMSKCKKCSMKALCRGGCAATVMKKLGNPLGVCCELWESPLFLEYFETVL